MWTELERDAWLGDAREDMTDDQLEALDDAEKLIYDGVEDPDMEQAAELEQRLSGALMAILGDADLKELGDDRRRAIAAYDQAHQIALGAVVGKAALASIMGFKISQTEMADQVGVTRQTIRAALGLA